MKEEAIKAPGSTIKQYSIMLQNRVGALTALLGLLDMHGIFCLGFSMQDCHEATIARLIVSDPERTSEIFLEKGICYTESGVLVAVLRHGPADLKKCLDALYAAEMNCISVKNRRKRETVHAVRTKQLSFFIKT